MTNLDITHPMVWAGRVFGFPDCCIRAFVDDWETLPTEHKFIGTGFRPCAHCNETKTKEQLDAEIASRRLIPYPFYKPEDNPLQDRYCRSDFEFTDELDKTIKTIPYLYKRHQTEILPLIKENWFPVERELRCYRGKATDIGFIYFFTNNFRDRYIPILLPNGEVVMGFLKKKSFRNCNRVDSRTAAKLREQYPDLYANRDFQFDGDRFVRQMVNRIVELSK